MQYCDKQPVAGPGSAASSVYGTMRRSRDASCQLTQSRDACHQLSQSTSASGPLPGVGGQQGGEEHGIVVPPPPMFEEGKLSMKTPLIHKKCCKDGKKDKIESRV